jgi:hypothetical protein
MEIRESPKQLGGNDSRLPILDSQPDRLRRLDL